MLRSLPWFLLFGLLCLGADSSLSSRISVDERLTLLDLSRDSTHIFVVSHAPPKHPVVSGMSVVHLKIERVLKASDQTRKGIIQVFHFHEDLLARYKKSQKKNPKESEVVAGYKSSISLEEALRGHFIVFLAFRDKRFHFTAPGSYEKLSKLPQVEDILAAERLRNHP